MTMTITSGEKRMWEENVDDDRHRHREERWSSSLTTHDGKREEKKMKETTTKKRGYDLYKRRGDVGDLDHTYMMYDINHRSKSENMIRVIFFVVMDGCCYVTHCCGVPMSGCVCIYIYMCIYTSSYLLRDDFHAVHGRSRGREQH